MATVNIYSRARNSTRDSHARLSATMALYSYARNETDGRTPDAPSFINESFLRPLQKLLPRGRLWNQDEGTVLTSLMRAISYSFAVVVRRALELIEESDPRTTTEMIGDWERLTGLPGDCTSPPTELQDRRDVVVTKLRGHVSPTEPNLLTIAEDLGYTDATIETYIPFAAGSRAGDHVYDAEWRFRFDVARHPGDNDGALACRVDEISPLHGAHGQIATYGNWIARTSGVATTLYNVERVLDMWIAIGGSGVILTSPRLQAWTTQTPDASYTGSFRGIVQSGSVAVICGSSGEVQTSPDGENWTRRTTPVTTTLTAVASNGSRLVTVGFSGTIITSDDDGVTWIARTPAASYTSHFYSAIYGNGVFLAIGVDGEVQTSADGATWTHAADLGTIILFASTFNGSIFCIGAASGEMYYSADGTTWTAAASVTGLGTLASNENDGVLLAGSLSSDEVFTSTDSLSWLSRLSTSDGVRGSTIKNDTAVVVGSIGLIYSSERASL